MANYKDSTYFDKKIHPDDDSAESKRTIFDFLAQVMIVFAFVVLALSIFSLLFGEEAQDFSSIFALGNQGIPTKVIFQFFIASVLMVGIRFLFISDWMIRKMPDWLRTLCMLTLILGVIVVFVVRFHWFPVEQGKSWALFLVCYLVSFLGSTIVTMLKIKAENRQLEEALQRLKEENGGAKRKTE